MNNQIISLVGWRFLPDLATGWVQSIYYSLTIRAGKPKPIPGSARFNRDRRRIYIGVISVYLLFTIYEADWEIRQKPNFLQILNLTETVNDREIKARFRRLAAIHHPDKVINKSPSAEAFFVQLRLAQDTLLDPVKRFAYERFGPAMLKWQHCSTKRDYLIHGLYISLPSYIGAAFVMYLFEFLGYVKIGNFWRWVIFVCSGVFEFHTVSSPHIPPILTKFINPFLTSFTRHPAFLPFQLIQLAHKICVTLYIALSQLGPFFQPMEAEEPSDLEIRKNLASFEAKVKSIDAEASRLVSLNLTPFFQEKSSLDNLQERMREWLVQNTIRMDPEVIDAASKILEKNNLEVGTITNY
ncbi:putative membrane associated chaperone [Erysiphe neolycopersici]|uniref:Putative membrane associated chaperone n=1 Tax=Erysiphe neolycopersici TaxID=212602 RepID=A0A420H9Z5_9PEZI|nr:putative membrane associated chaperone [Erysiphe neolycopersici]